MLHDHRAAPDLSDVGQRCARFLPERQSEARSLAGDRTPGIHRIGEQHTKSHIVVPVRRHGIHLERSFGERFTPSNPVPHQRSE